MTKSEYHKQWSQTPSGQASIRKYLQSEKGIAYMKQKSKRAWKKNSKKIKMAYLDWYNSKRGIAYRSSEKCKSNWTLQNNKRRQRLVVTILTTEQIRLIKAIYARAKELRQWFDVVVDHIVPIARGGLHLPENLQIIYRFENSAKYDRIDYIPRVIFS